LAVDYFVKIVRRRDISRFHSYLVRANTHRQRGLFIFTLERLSRRSGF
jgi:hypothetical protein